MTQAFPAEMRLPGVGLLHSVRALRNTVARREILAAMQHPA
jgi:hypothetical protein